MTYPMLMKNPSRPTVKRRGGRINDHGTKVERMLYDGRNPSQRSRLWRDSFKKDAEPFYNKRGDAHDDHERRQHRRDDSDRRLVYDQDRHHDYDSCHDYHWGNRSSDRGPTHSNTPFYHFSGEDPYKWLNEVEHYFAIHRVPQNERVYMVSLYLHGKAYK